MTFRSMTADPSVKSQKLKPGTIKRIIGYGKPYESQITIFLVTVIIEALLVVTTPLLLRELIDKGVIPKDAGLVTKLALLVGLLAVVDAGFNIFGRWYSARIGEGLIYDSSLASFCTYPTSINCLLYPYANGGTHFTN
jgi:ATP-binding cassette subfamily B protein